MPANHDADNYDDGDNDDYDDDGDADAADALLWNAVDPRKPLDLISERGLYIYIPAMKTTVIRICFAQYIIADPHISSVLCMQTRTIPNTINMSSSTNRSLSLACFKSCSHHSSPFMYRK